MPVQRTVVRQVGSHVPVAPAMVAADGNPITSGRRASDAHGHSHRLPARTGVARHVGPRVQFTEQIGQIDFGRSIERAQTAIVDRLLHGGVHVRIGKSEQTCADSAVAHVDEPAPVQVPYLAPARAAVVRRPKLGQVALGLLAQELNPSGDTFLSPAVKAGSFGFSPVDAVKNC